MARAGTLGIPIRLTFDEETRDLLDRAASQLEFHATQGFDGAASSDALAEEIRELLGEEPR